jgi:hypothetical protein
MTDNKEKYFLKSKTIWGSIISGIIAISPFIDSLAGDPALIQYAPILATISAMLGFLGRTKADSKLVFKTKQNKEK